MEDIVHIQVFRIIYKEDEHKHMLATIWVYSVLFEWWLLSEHVGGAFLKYFTLWTTVMN